LQIFRGQVYHGDHVRSAAVRAVLGATPRVPFTERVVREVELIEARRDEVINQAMRFEAFPLAMPLVANAVLQRAKTRRECLTIALEVRASAQARRFRRYCRVVDEAIHDGDRRRVERAIAELGRYGVRLSQSISGDSTKIDSTAVKELVTFASPLAAALVSVFRMPVADVIDQIRNRKFALLSEVRASQRGAAARQRFDDLWATLPPAPSASEWPRARDFRKRWGG
jgi:hypothetical protein